MLDDEDSVLLGDTDRFLLLLAPFEEEAVELLLFFANSASRAGAKDSTTAFKVLLSVIDESSAVGEKTTLCINKPHHYIKMNKTRSDQFGDKHSTVKNYTLPDDISFLASRSLLLDLCCRWGLDRRPGERLLL